MGEKQAEHVEPEQETSAPLALSPAASKESSPQALAPASAASKESSPEEKPPKHDSSEKALVPIEKPVFIAEKRAEHREDEKNKVDPKDRDAALARVELEKRLALIKAWEESEKAKADNKAYKKLSSIGAWENTKKASVEVELKLIEEEFEKKKAKAAERMKNKMAEIHRKSEEKRAMVEAKRGEDILKVEETAAKFRSTGNVPKKLFACFGS
ncbi:remorin [Coffea arabica]|uniref:Remorin n=1 Tax=Coffea arabica TaxID=13443 RepID=A0A6P6U3I5_COFAR|nr:remorin 1.4-like [Coffea arabica]